MSNPCAASTCLNGNCAGCRNGNLFCEDPRCYPDCEGCSTSVSSSSNWVIVTIILVLLIVLLAMGFFVGYGWFTDRQKASEPKKITVNKHVHTAVMSPGPTSLPVPENSPFTTEVTQTSITDMGGQVKSQSSYSGINLSMGGIPDSGSV